MAVHGYKTNLFFFFHQFPGGNWRSKMHKFRGRILWCWAPQIFSSVGFGEKKSKNVRALQPEGCLQESMYHVGFFSSLTYGSTLESLCWDTDWPSGEPGATYLGSNSCSELTGQDPPTSPPSMITGGNSWNCRLEGRKFIYSQLDLQFFSSFIYY